MWTNRRIVVPALTAVAVGAVAVSVALISQESGRRPPILSLPANGGLDPAPGTSSTHAGSDGYELVDDLPQGTPADARAWSLPGGPSDVGVVRALASALGAGTPVRAGAGWRAGGLFVSGDSGRAWWWAPCAADAVVSSDSQVGCATAAPGSVAPAPPAGSTSPPYSPPAALPSEPVRAAAAPVLRALGLRLGDAQITTSSYDGRVTVPRTVGGLEVFGFDTSIQVDAAGSVVGGSGWLAEPAPGDRYPLLSAQVAFDALPSLPRPMTAVCPVAPDGQGCAQPTPVQISGAHLGLSLQRMRSGAQMLLPSWLFEVKQSTTVVPSVAVQPRYLGGGGSSSTEPPRTSAPRPTAPPGGSTDPGPTRVPLRFDAAHPHSKGVAVVYGDSSSCPNQRVTHQVKEGPDSVVVSLETDMMQPLVACTSDYRAVEVVVALREPLGSRTVIDGATGKPVEVTPR